MGARVVNLKKEKGPPDDARQSFLLFSIYNLKFFMEYYGGERY